MTAVLGLGVVLLLAAGCGGTDRVGFGGAPTPAQSAQPGQPAQSGQPGQPAQSGQPGQPAQSAQPGQTSGGLPSRAELPPPTVVPPAGTVAVPAAQVDASGLPDGFPTTVWTTEGGRVVGLYGRAGGCTTASADLVEQGAQRVVIRLGQATTSTGPCPQVLYFPPLSIRLDAPLGQRTVALVMPRVSHGPPATK